jgi:hypothetical protein
MQDVFISHASQDKQEYVLPLVTALSSTGVTYWLDATEISWGDSIVGKINEGLKTSRKLLLCLSRRFLERKWPQAELDSALAQQIESGETRVLPLILNSCEEVLSTYPLLRSSAYRVFEQGVDAIADEVAALSAAERRPRHGLLRIRIESAHSGRLCDVIESPAVSIAWLASKAKAALGGRDRVDAGGLELLRMRWILVDVKAEDHWMGMAEHEKRKLFAIVMVGDDARTATADTTSLRDLGVRDETVFHLYGIALGQTVIQMNPPRKGPFDLMGPPFA